MLGKVLNALLQSLNLILQAKVSHLKCNMTRSVFSRDASIRTESSDSGSGGRRRLEDTAGVPCSPRGLKTTPGFLVCVACRATDAVPGAPPSRGTQTHVSSSSPLNGHFLSLCVGAFSIYGLTLTCFSLTSRFAHPTVLTSTVLHFFQVMPRSAG